jgi:hypothetical protein
MDLATLTWVHTAISIVALLAGPFAIAAVLRSERGGIWTTIFLVTAIATSAIGFLFPFENVLPSHITGVIALVVLAAVIWALIGGYRGALRGIYAVGMVLTLYFLVFVAIAQAFLKIPALHQMAPTQSDPAFLGAQLVALVGFLLLAAYAARAFHPAAGTNDLTA